jgi:hypothetical protein
MCSLNATPQPCVYLTSLTGSCLPTQPPSTLGVGGLGSKLAWIFFFSLYNSRGVDQALLRLFTFRGGSQGPLAIAASTKAIETVPQTVALTSRLTGLELPLIPWGLS